MVIVFTRRKKVNGYDCTLPVDVCSYSSALFCVVRSRHKKCTGIFTLNFNSFMHWKRSSPSVCSAQKRPDLIGTLLSRADRGAEIIKFCFYVLRSRGVSLSHVLLMLCVNRYGVLYRRKKRKHSPYTIYTRENHKNHARRTKRAIFFYE